MRQKTRPRAEPPRGRDELRHLLAAALFAALIAVFSQLMIPLLPVPINLAFLSVLLAGFVLPQRWAMISVGAYLLMGAIGLPVFAGLRGGPQALFSHTGGYLLGYFLSIVLVSLLRDRADGFVKRFALCLLGLLACYVPGTLWLTRLTGQSLGSVLPMAVYPFVPGDLLKCLAAALAAPRLQAVLARSGLA